MLKLEKNRNEISIRLSSKDKFLNRSLLIALAIAFSLHFLAFAIFNVHIYFFQKENGFIPPVEVHSSIEDLNNNNLISSQVEDDKNPLIKILRPKKIIPKIEDPKFSYIPIESKISFKENRHDSFAPIENEIEHKSFTNILSQTPILKINLSGNLSDLKILPLDLKKISQIEVAIEHLKQLKELSLSFDVQVDGKSGRIFWIASKEAIEDNSLDQFFIDLLKEIQFQKSQSPSIYVGEIDLVFSL